MRPLLTLLLTISCCGCFSTVKSSQTLDAAAIAGWKTFDYADWTQVVTTYVNDKGQVDYGALEANRGPLDRFVALLASVGPASRPGLFETKEQQLAYYINAYNALTMFNVINRLPELKSVNDVQKDFFYFTEFELDGNKTSLYK